MNRENIILPILSTIIWASIIATILIVIKVSGQENLLKEFLQTTASGTIQNIAFTAGGPFGMWIIIYLLFRFSSKSMPLGTIKLFLRFTEDEYEKNPPTNHADFLKAKCFYSVYDNGNLVLNDKEVKIQTDKDVGPYIYVKAEKIENPEFEVKLEYNEIEWFGDSYSPKIGGVKLQ